MMRNRPEPQSVASAHIHEPATITIRIMALSSNLDPAPQTEPPSVLDERAVRDLIAAFDTQLPAILQQLADLLGRAAPRLSARERQQFRVRLNRKVRLLVPAFADVEVTASAPDSPEKFDRIKAALRGVLIEMAAPPHLRKSPDADKLDWLVAMAAKATDLPRSAWARQPAYPATRHHLWNVLVSVYARVPPFEVQAVFDAWAADNDHRRYAHAVRLLTVAAARFRTQPPQRITDPAAVALQDEYLRSASVFEQQLRLVTCLTRIEPGNLKPWSYWQGQNLNDLVAMAAKHDDLREVTLFLDRHVRNALTHGAPIIERAARRCHFWDRDKCVTWTWEEYFCKTRALTLMVLACANLHSFRQLIEVQILARILAPGPADMRR